MENELRQLWDGETGGELLVAYTDMHGLWGGVTLSATGSGEYERTVRARGGEPETSRGRVAPERVRELVRLLVELEAWEQRVADRPPVPDESRARLVVRLGAREVEIWEWHADLERNRRLVRVRDLMLAMGEGAR